jgi:hypothetical protein
MKSLVVGWAVFTALAALGLLLAWFLAPGRIELELDVFLLVVGGLGLFEIVLATRDVYPLEKRSALAAALEREPGSEARPPEIERIERELTISTANAFDLHVRLRPTLRTIASARLAERGLRLDEDGEELLGEDLWELLRPDRLPPADRHAPGISPEALREAVDRVEAL